VKDRVLELLAVRKLALSRRESDADEPAVETQADSEAEGLSASAENPDTEDLKAEDPKAEDPRGALDERPQKGSEARSEGKGAPILLFVGPPGVGKTSIAKSIARAPARWVANMYESPLEARATRPTYEGTGAPTSERCQGESSRV